MSEERRTEYVSIDKVVPALRNPKRHSQPNLILSLERFGFTKPILKDMRTGKLVAGHGILEALQEMRDRGKPPPVGITEDWKVPVIIGWSSTNDDEANAYLAADNYLCELPGWDNRELLALLDSLDDLEGTGFTLEAMRAMEAEITQLPKTPLTDPDHVPSAPKRTISRKGDVWVLGVHRVMCGDSTEVDDVLTLMGEFQGAEMLHADPPYGMGKEADGVANDNLYQNKLSEFQMRWWSAWRPYLADNASTYIWGNAEELWRLWYAGGLKDSGTLSFRNEIVWAKGSARGMSSDSLRCFPTETERCMFLMLGEQGSNANYWEGWEPVRSYLDGEVKKAGWTSEDVKAITGVSMFSHWFTKSQWSFITKQHYEALQKAGKGTFFTRDYQDLERDFHSTRADFHSTRAHFDNTHDNMTDVWQFPSVHGSDRHGHATPKPVALLERAIKSSCVHGGVVLEPFAGSGSTLIAAESTGRRCFTMELKAEYVDVVCKRFQENTGITPILESTGEPVDFGADKESATRE